MLPGERRRRWWSVRAVCLLLYAVMVAGAPFTHHDLACHTKTPVHCTACASSHLGSSPHAPAMPGAWLLRDAGAAVADILTPGGAPLAPRTTGRSPPFAL